MLEKKETCSLTFREPPHYYEVRDEFGKRFRHCGTQRDANYHVINNPGYTWDKVYFPLVENPIVNVSSEVVVDKELPEQKILPESESIPLDLN